MTGKEEQKLRQNYQVDREMEGDPYWKLPLMYGYGQIKRMIMVKHQAGIIWAR